MEATIYNMVASVLGINIFSRLQIKVHTTFLNCVQKVLDIFWNMCYNTF